MIVFLKNLINRLSINNSIVNINNRNIKIAVNDWMQNAEKAEAKYGHISNWNTSKVTTMKKLFFKVPLFNQPIGDLTLLDMEIRTLTDERCDTNIIRRQMQPEKTYATKKTNATCK